ncbi:MAG TPA: hypothetical protein VF042_09835 [Gemmatimonadaceae bacterium]
MKFFTSQVAARVAAGALMSLALAVTSSAASAQYGRNRDSRNEILQWSGSVDREIQIEVDNRRAQVYEVGSNERARRRVNMNGSIPNRPGRLYVQVLQGRGHVDVIEQPSARNGYRATIRLRDPQGGASRYRIAAYWEGERRNNGRRN